MLNHVFQCMPCIAAFVTLVDHFVCLPRLGFAVSGERGQYYVWSEKMEIHPAFSKKQLFGSSHIFFSGRSEVLGE